MPLKEKRGNGGVSVESVKIGDYYYGAKKIVTSVEKLKKSMTEVVELELTIHVKRVEKCAKKSLQRRFVQRGADL